MFQYVRVAAVGLALAASVHPAGSQELAIALEPVTTGLTSPVDVTHAGDDTGRLFIVQQTGQIRILQDGTLLPTPFLDIASLVSCCGERGLLGLAFHPDYRNNGLFYVDYTNVAGDTVVARFEVSGADPNQANPASRQTVLTFDQPFSNHNGGAVRFGPDGYLYISTGDGGSGGDPQDNGQHLNTLLGKLLRIDVDGDDFPTDPERNYAIPPDNPFVGVAALDEIWAYGLRNPWRFNFDRATGDLWIGDVGQNVWEEIDLQPAASAGGENYGWDVLEGGLQPGIPGPAHPNCFEDDPGGDGSCADFLTGGSVLPVLEYGHSLGCSVTGGLRYRGQDEGQLGGVYFYADYCSGRIWGTLPRCEQGWASRQFLDTPFSIATFGEDEAGELYVANHNGGVLHRVTVAAGSGGPVLTPDPDSIDFGSTGGTAEIVLQHTGTGADAVVVEALEVSDPGNFSVDPNGGANPCGPAPICLPQGASCTITVTFDPGGSGIFNETLSFDANSPPAAVTLFANVPDGGTEPALSVLVREGEEIPGYGIVSSIDDITVNDAGDWIVEVSYTPTGGGSSESLILKNGEVLVATGDPVEPAPSTVGSTSNLLKALNDPGSTAFRLALDGGPSPNGMYYNLTPVVLNGDISKAPQFTPGTPYIGFFRARLDNSERLFLVASVDDPKIPSSVDRALVWFEPDGKGGWTEDAIAVEGDVLPGMGDGEFAADFGTDYFSFMINSGRDALYTVSIANAPSATNGAIYLNDTMLVRKGDPSPLPGSVYTDIGPGTRVDMNEVGDYIFRANLSGLPSGEDTAILRNEGFGVGSDVVFLREGDEAPGTGETITGFGTGPSARIDDLGEIFWFATITGDTSADQVLFVDDELLARKGVTGIDGDVITTVGGTTATGGITRGFSASRNCRYVIVRAVLDGVDQAAVLIDRAGPEGTRELEIAPEVLDFGEVVVGETGGPLSLALTSTGDLVVTVDEVAGPDVPFEAVGGTCLPAPFALAPGESCTLDYSFSPTAAGPAASAITFTSDASSSPQTIPLQGVGTGFGEGVTPGALLVDPQGSFSDGNGVFEPGEIVDVAPAWRNDDVAPQSLTGTATLFTGPAGAAYFLVDDAADYGLVDPGATGSCLALDACYGMGLNTPVPRPTAHWDATFDEALTDGPSGFTWTLHIGDSFTDVPRTSLFYPWIETLLHNAVTGGCSPTTYCPAVANTRDQMSVFLLKALEGGSYVPPACVDGEELFADVLFDNIFCPWIEDLAGRGVTAGCGGGNYCPGNPVSRDQIAVFLLRTLLGPGYAPPACAGVFADVPCPSLFANWIEDLVARGITAGCGGGAYCPATPVSRDQMAVFLAKTFGLVLYGP